jgi:hypothetical protein
MPPPFPTVDTAPTPFSFLLLSLVLSVSSIYFIILFPFTAMLSLSWQTAVG